MKTVILVLMLVLATMVGLGCGTQTLVYSGPEHDREIQRTVSHDERLLVEDVDTFLLLDRPTRLTRWNVR